MWWAALPALLVGAVVGVPELSTFDARVALRLFRTKSSAPVSMFLVLFPQFAVTHGDKCLLIVLGGLCTI